MISLKQRNKEIEKLYKKGLTFKEIGFKYKISKNRVWQIYHQKDHKVFYCKKHNKKYTTQCPFCKIDKYYNNILSQNGNIKDEIIKLNKQGRQSDNVRKKKIIIVQLRDKFHFPFTRIANLFNYHHSSIIHLYYSFKNNDTKKRRSI